MADTGEQQDIRTLETDKKVKGFEDAIYKFKDDLTITPMKGDSVRWYQKTSTHLTATSPARVANKAVGAVPVTLKQSWTRVTSYVKDYSDEDTLATMDIDSTDVDIFNRSVMELTFAVIKQIDTDIYNGITESQSPSTIQTTAAAAAWNTASFTGVDMVADFATGQRKIAQYDYPTVGKTVAWMNPTQLQYMKTWLISTKGSSIPSFSDEKIRSGVILNFLGTDIRESNNVVSGGFPILVKGRAGTWYDHTPLKSMITNININYRKIEILARGVFALTDPKAVHYTSGVGV